MKLWLDDERQAPDDTWTHVCTASRCIYMLNCRTVFLVKELSLDHDLGEGNGTGYDVVCWLEQETANGRYVPPTISIHSANPVGRARMRQGLDSIDRLRLKHAAR